MNGNGEDCLVITLLTPVGAIIMTPTIITARDTKTVLHFQPNRANVKGGYKETVEDDKIKCYYQFRL